MNVKFDKKKVSDFAKNFFFLLFWLHQQNEKTLNPRLSTGIPMARHCFQGKMIENIYTVKCPLFHPIVSL